MMTMSARLDPDALRFEEKSEAPFSGEVVGVDRGRGGPGGGGDGGGALGMPYP
jgi:hypothetical protein